MSYAVVHMQKIKTAGIKGMQFHNQRERESRTNLDINKDRSHLNYDLHNTEPVNYNERVKQIIADHVETTRAIRKDAVKMCNFLISSDKGFFDGLSIERQREFFQRAYDFFKDRYGEANIVACPVHLDEHTPHAHLSLVPVTDDHKLSAKRLFDRNELRSIQDDFPKHMQSYGFNLERGIDAEGKNKHLTVMEYKKQALSQDVNELTEELRTFQERLEEIQDTKLHMDNVDAVQAKSALLRKGEVLVGKEDFERLKTFAKKLKVVEDKARNQEYEIERLGRELGNTKSDFDKAYKLLDEEKLKTRKANDKNTKLTKELEKTQGNFQEIHGMAKTLVKYLQSIGKLEEFQESIKKSQQQEADRDVQQRKPKPKIRDRGPSL